MHRRFGINHAYIDQVSLKSDLLAPVAINTHEEAEVQDDEGVQICHLIALVGAARQESVQNVDRGTEGAQGRQC